METRRFYKLSKIIIKKNERKWSKKKWWILVRAIRYLIIRFIQFALILLSLLVIADFITYDITIALSGSIYLIILFYDFLRFMTKVINYQDEKKLKKSYKYNRQINLYRWSEGLDLEERAFFEVLIGNASRIQMVNLKALKRNIEKLCGNDKTNLKLLDAYIERRLSSNPIDKFWSIFLGLIVSGITAIINKTVVSKDTMDMINKYIYPSNIDYTISGLTMIINNVTYFIIIVLLFSYYWNLFNRDKQRLKLISKIINISIEEI